MPFKKFEKGDLFKNSLKTTPTFQFKVYAGKVYLNNSQNGFSEIKSLNVPSDSDACSNPNAFDFSCEDNSYNIAPI